MIKEYKYKGEQIKLTKHLSDEGMNYNLMRRLIRQKDIKINGIRVKEDCLIKNGDTLCVYYDDNYNPTIVYEDDNILVADKRKGMSTVGAESLEHALQRIYGESLCAVHRIDTNTDGLCVFAKNQLAKAELEKAFYHRQIIKKYACMVCGRVDKKHDIIENYLFKVEDESIVLVSDTEQKGWLKAITEYTVVAEKEDYTLLEVVLHTGRTHQIRAVMAHIGHPIAGDGKYGKLQSGLNKQQLTAYSVSFQFDESSSLYYLNDKTIVIDYKPRIRF